MQSKPLRNAVFELARGRYSTEAEYLWARTPNFGVLRHPNGKWYAAVMDITKYKKVCPMDVDMMDNSRSRKNGTECILCMECVKICPKDAL